MQEVHPLAFVNLITQRAIFFVVPVFFLFVIQFFNPYGFAKFGNR